MNFPSAIAQAMEFIKGEVVEWVVEDKGLLALKRRHVPESLPKNNFSGGLMEEYQKLWGHFREAFARESSWERFDTGRMFSVVRRETVGRLEADQPVVTFMDDTLLKGRGQKVSGTSWHRDANGPKFCCSFVWAGTLFAQALSHSQAAITNPWYHHFQSAYSSPEHP